MTQFKNEEYTRQLGLLPMESLDRSITIIGAGAIGGWTALSLTKMGFLNTTVYDFDTVDTVNMNSQLYRKKDVGNAKVLALQNIINDFTGHDIQVHGQFYGGILTSDIVISAVDSMATRKLIWESVKNNGFVKMFIDPRMGAESALLYVINPNDAKDIATYEKTLYTDDQAVAEPCTMKSTSYCAMALSGLVCTQVKSIATNNTYSRITQWNLPSGGFTAWSNKGESNQ